MAAVFFVLALLAAVCLVTAYQPQQHPLVLLGTLPGAAGWLFRAGLFIVPGLLVGISMLCLPRAVLLNRAGRLGQHLGLIAALGFMLMGLLGVDLEGSLEVALRGQAMAWLLWLAAAGAAMVAMLVGSLQRGRFAVAAISLLSIALIGLLSLGTVPGLAPPLAQALSWGVWMAWAAGLARLGAPAGQSMPDDVSKPLSGQ